MMDKVNAHMLASISLILMTGAADTSGAQASDSDITYMQKLFKISDLLRAVDAKLARQ